MRVVIGCCTVQLLRELHEVVAGPRAHFREVDRDSAPPGPTVSFKSCGPSVDVLLSGRKQLAALTFRSAAMRGSMRSLSARQVIGYP